MRKTGLALLLAVLASGCAGLDAIARGAFEKPRLTFRSAAVEGLDLEGATVAFQFDLENPNPFGLSLARVGWAIDVEGTRIASGDVPGGLAIPASGSAPVTFPVHVRFQDVPGIVSILRGGRDEVAYRLSGAIGVRTPVGVVEVPLSHADRLRLPGLPRFAIEGLGVKSVGLSTVSLAVRLRVENPNRFPVPAGQLDYALTLGDAPVARVAGADLSPVPGGATSVVEIPVRIDVAAAGRAAADLLRGAETQVALRGTARLAGLPLPLDLRTRVPARR